MADEAQEQQQPEGPSAEQVDGDAAVEQGGEDAVGEQQEGQTMTKSQMKKLRKRQYYEEKKRLRKEQEKQRKLEEQTRRREEGRQRMEAMTAEEQEAYRDERNARSAARKQERQESRARMEKALESGQKVVIDLDFADYMADSEQKSICGQLAYSWHANCAAQHPLHLVLSGVQGKMKEVLDRQVSGYSNWKATVTPQSYIDHFADKKDKLVYLTADSQNELDELDPSSIYIIGGIVDRNRHKLLCFNKAEGQGIAHARLPIGEYMKLASSQVMTTNHVIEILLRWLELRDWKQAFEAVIPPRKRQADEEGEQPQQQEQQQQHKAKQQKQAGAEQQQQQPQQAQLHEAAASEEAEGFVPQGEGQAQADGKAAAGGESEEEPAADGEQQQ